MLPKNQKEPRGHVPPTPSKAGASFHVLIAAAGASTRFGTSAPKPYVNLAGMSILRRSILAFLDLPGLQSLRVVYNPAHEALYHEAVRGLSLPAPIAGGKTRQESIYKGLLSFSDIPDEDKILVHDAARPLVQTADLAQILTALQAHDSVCLAAPVVDSLSHANGTRVSRDGLYALQTPQGFGLNALLRAHQHIHKHAPAGPDFSDDTSLFQAATGIAPHFVVSSSANFKITTQQDLIMAQRLLQPPLQTRVGTGFDVHAFDTGGDHVVLGGVRIPHTRALKGHSDADVALHALTDAILGALGEGDIGVHFPPSDAAYKGMDSAHFLAFAHQRVTTRGAMINNVDLTLICENPKIGPHALAMKRRIADILHITPDQIGIKATTTEGLGFTGRGEGIAAQAVVSLSCPCP